MKDRSLIDYINPTFLALTTMGINHCLSACNNVESSVPQEFCPGGEAQRKRDSKNIYHSFNNASAHVFCRLEADFCSSLPKVQAKRIDHTCSMICQRIHSTGTDPAMAQPHTELGSVDENLNDSVPEELIEQPDNCCNHLSSFIAATEASMQFSAVLPAITSSSQPVPCSDSNSNSNESTNMTSIEDRGLVDGSTVVDRAMSLGG